MSIETIVGDLNSLTESLTGDEHINLRVSLGFCAQKVRIHLFRSASIDFLTILTMEMSQTTRARIAAIALEVFTEHTSPAKLPRS